MTAGRRPLATLLACLVLLAAQVAAAAGASAHTELVSTTPADGGQLTTAPTDITLTFSEPVSPELAQVEVTGPTDDAVSDGDPQVDGATVAQGVLPLTEAGTYTVTWRVVAEDGHPISDSFAFTFAGAASDESPSPSDTAPSETALPDDAAPTSATTEQGSSWLPLVVGLAAAALLLAGATVLLSRRRRGPEATES